MSTARQISVFYVGEEGIFVLKKVAATVLRIGRLLPGEMENFTTGKALIVGLIALLSDLSLSRRERGALMAARWASRIFVTARMKNRSAS